MNGAIYNLIIALLILTPLVPLAALFGCFERYDNGAYRFRLGRLALVLLFAVAVGASFPLILFNNLGATIGHARLVAETATARAIVMQQYAEDNLGAVFPDLANSRTKSCYEAALSNYVEDKWQAAIHQTTCAAGLCAHDEKIFFEAVRHGENPHNFPMRDFEIMDKVFKVVWQAASGVFAAVHSFGGIIDPSLIGKPNIGTDLKAYQDFQHYISTCGALKPQPWAVSAQPLVIMPGGYCFGWACP